MSVSKHQIPGLQVTSSFVGCRPPAVVPDVYSMRDISVVINRKVKKKIVVQWLVIIEKLICKITARNMYNIKQI
jgi:hypothetical protein